MVPSLRVKNPRRKPVTLVFSLHRKGCVRSDKFSVACSLECSRSVLLQGKTIWGSGATNKCWSERQKKTWKIWGRRKNEI